MSKLVQPKLRFNNYKNSWVNESLKNILNISKKKYNPKILSENYKCIELENIESGTGRILGFKQSINQSSIKNSFQDGDVLYGKLRPYLKKFYKANFAGVCSSEIWVLKSNSLQGNFLYQFIQTYKFNDVANISSGSRMPRADWSYMSEVYFNIPESEEQEKIASFLSSVDKKIELLTKKHELLEKYKKGLMQKIFSQEIRFKKDDGSDFPDWEDRLIGKISKFKNGRPHEGNVSEDGKFNLISLDSIDVNGRLKNKHKKVIFNDNSLSENDLVMILSDIAYVQIIGLSAIIPSGNYVLNQRVGRIRMDKEFSSLFTAYYLNFNQIFFKKRAQGTSQKHIYERDINQLKLYFPTIDEQQKIASFLSALDKKIDLAKLQIEKTQTFKKGLLQQMFV